MTRNTEKRHYFRVTRNDLHQLNDADHVKFTVNGKRGIQVARIRVDRLLDRLERGKGTPSGKPSKDWMENGEHKDSTGIPNWIMELNEPE